MIVWLLVVLGNIVGSNLPWSRWTFKYFDFFHMDVFERVIALIPFLPPESVAQVLYVISIPKKTHRLFKMDLHRWATGRYALHM